MTIPVDWVKLMAFALGAMIAALAGSIFAAQQISVFPPDFDTPYLILVYAALILGGAGSIGGAVVGALVLNVTLDGVLRSPDRRRLRLLRPDPGDLAGQAAAVAEAGRGRWPRPPRSASPRMPSPRPSRPARWPAGRVPAAWIADALRDWVIVPANPQVAGNFGFVLLVCLLIALVQLRRRWRLILLPPTIYLASFVWETRLVLEPAITRQLMIGAILIVMMNARPQGLLGTRRVEALT